MPYYEIIYADPPWSYNDRGFGRRPGKSIKGAFNPQYGKRYNTMKLQDIVALGDWIRGMIKKDCCLFLWATNPLLPEAFSVISAWGFKFKTVAFVWSKVTVTGKEVANLGQWTMGNVELCLLATRGSPKRIAKNIRQLVVAERGEHSRKPTEVRNRIVELMGDVPRLELFAREESEGWDIWGDQIS